MNSLNKVVMLFAVLGIIGAGLFFFPGSPFYYKTFVVVTTPVEKVVVEEPASGDQETIILEEPVVEGMETQEAPAQTH